MVEKVKAAIDPDTTLKQLRRGVTLKVKFIVGGVSGGHDDLKISRLSIGRYCAGFTWGETQKKGKMKRGGGDEKGSVPFGGVIPRRTRYVAVGASLGELGRD